MKLHWSLRPTTAAARLAGRLDSGTAARLEELTTMARLLPFPVEVDLAGVTVADEKALAALRATVGRSDGRLSFVNGPPGLAHDQ